MARQEQLDALVRRTVARQAKKTQEPKPAVEDGKPSKNFDESHAQPHAYLFERDRQDASRDKGDGSNRLFAACCRCVEHDLPDDAALAVLAKYAKHKPFPSAWGSKSVIKRLRSAEKKVERGAAKKRRSGPSMLSVGQLLKDHPELRPACGNRPTSYRRNDEHHRASEVRQVLASNRSCDGGCDRSSLARCLRFDAGQCIDPGQ